MPSSKRPILRKSSSRVAGFINLVSIIVTRDLIISIDNTISCMHLCDELAIVGENQETIWPQINVCVEFARNMDKPFDEFNAAGLKLKVALKNPSGKLVDIIENEVNHLVSDDSWSINRLLLPLTGYLGFKSTGNYYFEVFGKTKDSEYELLLSRLLRVRRVFPEKEPVFK